MPRLEQRQPRGAVGAARHRRQQPHAAHAAQQQRDRAGVLVAGGLQPALQRALEGTGATIALALLAVGGAVDDGAQGLGDRARHRPRQPHHLVAERRQASHHLGEVGLVQRRVAGQRLVHHEAEGEHVDLGGQALHSALVHRGLVAVGVGGGAAEGLGERVGVGDLQAQQLHVADVVHQQRIGLQVAVGRTGLVREGQALQHLDAPGREFLAGQALGGELLAPGDELLSLIDGIGPALVLTDVEHAGEPGMLQAAGAADAGHPGAQRVGIGRLHARQRHHHLDVAVGVQRQPQHGLRALAEQTQQLVAAEHAHRAVRRDGTGSGGERGNGGDHERSNGRIARLERRRARRDARKKGQNGA